MKPEIKKKWLKALRSGLYEQGRGYLCRSGPDLGDSFCCLGVLCDLHARETGSGWEEINPYILSYCKSRSPTDGRLEPQIYTLPDMVRRWSGLRSTTATDTLEALNDRDGVDFEGIANWIEENL